MALDSDPINEKGVNQMPIPIKKTEPVTDYLSKSYLIYGQPKIGKTTLISNFGDGENEVLFFATEDGHKELSIYSWTTESGENPTSWHHFRQCVAEMTKQDKFRILAIDTADNLFDWCKLYVIAKYNEKAKANDQDTIDHESDVSFGKIYSQIKEELHRTINFLTQKGYSVIFISHVQEKEKTIKKRKILATDTTLPNTAKKVIHPMCYFIFYLYADEEGNRLIRTKGTDAITAGDRSGKLPEIIPLEIDGHSLKAALMGHKVKPNSKTTEITQ